MIYDVEKVYAFYRERIEQALGEVGCLRRKIHWLGTLRLALVVGTFGLIWGLRESGWLWITVCLLICIGLFAFLMWRHFILYARKSDLERLARLNELELKGLDYDFSAFDGATDKIDPTHPFSLDLDLFGDHSLFQSINRTVTSYGRELLANWLQVPLTDKGGIERRQAFVRELSGRTGLRQRFYVEGGDRSGALSDLDWLGHLAERPFLFLGNHWLEFLVWLVPAGWLVLLVTYALGWVAGSWLGFYLLFALVVGYARSKALNKLYERANRLEEILKAYARLARLLEAESFQSAEGKEIHDLLVGKDGTVASGAIHQLSRLIGGLDQRYSAAGVVLNLLWMRDARLAIRLEHWLARYGSEMVDWLNALARFDAYASLAGFAFNHPDYVYPTLTDHYFTMEGKRLGHPLLDRNRCVRNDVHVPDAPWFLIITGANMAGKSTYLRTIGVNYLLACVGAPVCAESLTLCPVPLMTSLRTSDSLVSHESYFFAELKRLRTIIQRLRQGERLFIILDEILKGTNSEDKQKGSLALMKQLVGLGSCGIIATHDLLLGTLEREFPEAIKNYRFEADIKNDELSFSYQLREGIAQNMNACFLMQKMGITV